jgi:hypothetical protein
MIIGQQSRGTLNLQAIVAGVAPPRTLSGDENNQRASIVSQLAADFNTFKQSLGDGRSNQYGADKRFFEARRPLYGEWLALDAIKRAAKRQRDKENKARASITPICVDVTQGNNSNSRESSPSPPQLLQIAPAEPNMGGRPVGSTNEAKKDLEGRKVATTDLITQQVKEARDADIRCKLILIC